MRASRRLATVVLLSMTILLLAQAPAFAPWRRASDVSINVLQVCPGFVTFEAVTREGTPPDPPVPPTTPITVQAYTPPPAEGSVPPEPPVENRILNQQVDLTFVPNGVQVPLGEGPPEPTWFYYGKFTLPWDGGATLRVGTPVAVGPENLFTEGPVGLLTFADFTTPVSDKCKPGKPKLDLEPVCAKATRKHLTWRVDNPASDPVRFTWKVAGSHQSGKATAPAKGSVEFTTRRVRGPDVVSIFVGGKRVDKERARCRCGDQ
jgi:hypothetical protein